jgi:hypothetical protein
MLFAISSAAQEVDTSGFGFEQSDFCVLLQTDFMLERMRQ